MKTNTSFGLACALAMTTTVMASAGCSAASDDLDEASQESANTAGIGEGTAEAAIVVRVANDLTMQQLIDDVKLSKLAALDIDAYRKGDDELEGTDDDQRFESIAELDMLPHVRAAELTTLLAFARTRPSAIISGRVLLPNDSPVQPPLAIYAFKTDGSTYFKHDGMLNRPFSLAVDPGDYYVVAYQSETRTFALATPAKELLAVSVAEGATIAVEPNSTDAKKIPIAPTGPHRFGCMGINYAGKCGTDAEYYQGAGVAVHTVTWCEGNILRRKECPIEQACAWQSDAIGNNCVPR